MNENKTYAYQNLWNAVKEVFRMKFTALTHTIINNLIVYFKELEKESKLNPKLKEGKK